MISSPTEAHKSYLSWIDKEDGRGLKKALISRLFKESIEAILDDPDAPATAYWAVPLFAYKYLGIKYFSP